MEKQQRVQSDNFRGLCIPLQEQPIISGVSLRVIEGHNINHLFYINKPENLVGRSSDTDIYILDEQISRSHLNISLIESNSGEVVIKIKDLNSMNGTYVNGIRIIEHTLKNGDTIKIGNTVLKIEIGLMNKLLFQSKPNYIESQYNLASHSRMLFKSNISTIIEDFDDFIETQYKLELHKEVHKTQKEFWLKLDGKQFEKEIATLYRNLGYTAILCSSGGGDEGVDIFLKNGDKTVVVQCKAYKSPKAKIAPAVIRDLFGTLNHFKAQAAILVSLTKCSKKTKQFAIGKPIIILSLDDIINLQKSIVLHSYSNIINKLVCLRCGFINQLNHNYCVDCGDFLVKKNVTERFSRA